MTTAATCTPLRAFATIVMFLTTNSCPVGRKNRSMSPITLSIACEWKTRRASVNIITMNGNSDRMTFAATLKA